MKGKIYYQRDRNRWRVYWYDQKARKDRFIYRYKGQFMACSAFKMKGRQLVLDNRGRPIPDKEKCQGYAMAQKLRALIQGRWEQHQNGECQFRIEEFTRHGWTDVVEYYHKWIEDAVKPRRKPATVKAYESYGRNWIEPFFTERPVQLHEVEADTLISLLNFIVKGLRKKETISPNTKLILEIHKMEPAFSGAEIQRKIKAEHGIKMSPSWVRRVIFSHKTDSWRAAAGEKNVGKTALNIMSALHKMMDYAHRAKRIPSIPPFPKKEDFELKPREIEYLSAGDLRRVNAHLPPHAIPIFRWLQMHFRRPGEACTIHKTDYDPINEVFKVRRALSAREEVDSVKTNWKKSRIHYVDCDPDFVATANRMLNQNLDSPYLFVNPRARRESGRWTLEALRNIWYRACDDADVERIWVYRGTKHTACMDFLENGGSDDELMILTDHANRESVKAYREITLNRKRQAREAAKKRRAAAERREPAPCQNLVNVVPLFKNRE